jgi:hypothetical protein
MWNTWLHSPQTVVKGVVGVVVSRRYFARFSWRKGKQGDKGTVMSAWYTTRDQQPKAQQNETRNSLKGQSSPGILHDGQHPSNGTRQIPQTSPSSSWSWFVFPVFQRHWATALQCLMWTFIDWYAFVWCVVDDEFVGATRLCEEEGLGLFGVVYALWY